MSLCECGCDRLDRHHKSAFAHIGLRTTSEACEDPRGLTRPVREKQ